jgi:hypothetical protein
MRKSKTFQEDTEVCEPFSWIDEIIWAHVNVITHRDPADMEHLLANKIKITIEIYNDEGFKYAGDYDTSTSKD